MRKALSLWLPLAGFGLLFALAPTDLRRAVFVERWPFWAGGLAIGAFVLLLLRGTGQPLGVSTGFADACGVATHPELRRSWRLPFIAGIVAGGLVAALLAGGPHATWSAGLLEAVTGASLATKAALFTAGGALLGFGARLAGGCTSGHSILGVSLLAPSSLLATACFMAAGFAVTRLLLGGL